MPIRTRRSSEFRAPLSPEIEAALVDSLFAPLPSLIIGAISCSIVGGLVAFRDHNLAIMETSAAIFAVGLLRVIASVLYRRSKLGPKTSATAAWERFYRYGAWTFAGLLGLLCWLTLRQTSEHVLQMAVTTTAAGYAAAIAGRNAGRPSTAVGQLALITLPMAFGLLLCPDPVQKILGVIVLLFVLGMIDITISVRDVIMRAATMTQKEAALAARFEEQAQRFDVALNTMAQGLCMLDRENRLLVWNQRFAEMLRLEKSSLRIGMTIPQILRRSIRAENHFHRGVRDVWTSLSKGFGQDSFEIAQSTPAGERILALSRRFTREQGSVVVLEDITDRRRAEEQIVRLAKYDDLTGLSNRSQFRAHINDKLKRLSVGGDPIAVHLIDLDRFKSVNDTLGHPIGDKLLKQASTRLRHAIGECGLVTRFGGDEFVVLQTSRTNDEGCSATAQLLLDSLAEPFEVDGHRIDIGGSIGIAIAPNDGTDPDQLLKKADLALYQAKNGGGGQYRFFVPEMEKAIQDRRSLELDLRKAITNEEFQLHYQPIVDLATGRVSACEALLRWSHPIRGFVGPSEFIPIAEETGLIVPLGEWILKQACLEAVKWPSDVKIAVNLSPVQFRGQSLIFSIVEALKTSGLPAQRLELEITERVLLEASESTLVTMQQLKELGTGISLDDFGTGYSSLNYLRKFPFDKIKIDQSFIRDVGEQTQAPAIIRAVASLGEGLKKLVVAEGIETFQQMEMVRSQGCHQGQGFFFGVAMPSFAIRARLRRERFRSRVA